MDQSTAKKPWYKDGTHMLYVSVILAVVLGVIVGLVAPGVGKSLEPLGKGFVKLITMMISPIIFCTLVLGVGSVAKAITVGKVGGMAIIYFLVMSTFALAIGLIVGNVLHPGDNLHYEPTGYTPEGDSEGGEAGGLSGFLMGIIPTSLLSSLTSGKILQTLLVALLVGFALQRMGEAGKPILKFVGYVQALVFRLLGMIMWVAPVGAFGAMAAVVGSTGLKAVGQMAILMIGFYITCILFIVVVLGALLKFATGVNILKLMKYLAREYLLIFSTSSSEAALPRLIAKMEHVGVSKPVVGIVVPTGYSFNLDGTAIYLTMASIFVSDAMGKPLELGQQISLLVFMIIASKGAAGVSGAGIATLAAGLKSHRPDLVDGVGLILGIDRFMSEARALTNFTGNAVAALLMGKWSKEIDMGRVHQVLDGKLKFDESTMGGDFHGDIDGEDKQAVPVESASASATQGTGSAGGTGSATAVQDR